MVERPKTEKRDLITSDATRQTRSLKMSEAKKELKRKRSSNKTPKANFFNLLDMETNATMASAEEDMLLERRLAKKLKVKSGRLTNANYDLDMLLEGIPPMADNLGKTGKNDKHAVSLKTKMMDSVNEDSDDQISSGEGTEEADLLSSDEEHEDVFEANSQDSNVSSVLDKLPNNGTWKYVAPHLRSRGGNELAEVRKRLRGLLNRLSETNVESITGDISALVRSIGRAVGTQIVTEEIVTSCSGGPRGNEQYAAVFAAFSAGMACLVGMDFGAKLLACLANCFEEEYMKEANLSLRNLTLLLSYLYVFGLCSSELIYDFLIMLGKRLTEVDVSTVLTVLQCCGMKLRGDDLVGMKSFIHSVQSRVNELKASAESGQSNISSKRMEFMIETICDIKNNKKRSKEDTVQHTRIKKWLQKLRVEDILLRTLKWSKLIDPNKKGQWWLSGDAASTTEMLKRLLAQLIKRFPKPKRCYSWQHQ